MRPKQHNSLLIPLQSIFIGAVFVSVWCGQAALVQAKTVYEFLDSRGVLHLSNTRPADCDVLKTYSGRGGGGSRPAPVPEDVLKSVHTELEGAAKKFGIESFLLKAIAHAESAFNPRAVSPKGAQGVMQLMPATASRFSVKDPFDIAQNIEGSCHYIKFLLQRFDGYLPHVIAAYNAGENNVTAYNGIPPFRETIDYVARVTDLIPRYGGPQIEVPRPSQTEPTLPTLKFSAAKLIKMFIDSRGIVHLTNR